MASPHSSLASLLAYPNASNPSGDMDDQPGAVAQSEMLECESVWTICPSRADSPGVVQITDGASWDQT